MAAWAQRQRPARRPPGRSPIIRLGMGLSHTWSGSLISTYFSGMVACGREGAGDDSQLQTGWQLALQCMCKFCVWNAGHQRCMQQSVFPCRRSGQQAVARGSIAEHA